MTPGENTGPPYPAAAVDSGGLDETAGPPPGITADAGKPGEKAGPPPPAAVGPPGAALPPAPASPDDSAALRFAWAALPAASAGLPGTGGRLRLGLDDFAVDEIPRYAPSGSGAFAYARIEKRGLTTHDLAAALRAGGVPYHEIGLAGLKDKYAVTTQWLSVPERWAPQLAALDELPGIRVLEASRHSHRLKPGHHRGNRFRVTVRQPAAAWPELAAAILDRIAASGLPNYFGPQRFGRFNSNALDARRLLRGEAVPGGRRLGKFFISALQSHLFNWNLKRRIERGLFAQVVSGDRAQKHDTGGVFVVDDAAAESPRAARLEISALLPLYGRKVRGGDREAAVLEQETLDGFGLSRSEFRPAAKGDWRSSRCIPGEVAIAPHPEGYTISFTLPAGAYATVFLRELTKSEQTDFRPPAPTNE